MRSISWHLILFISAINWHWGQRRNLEEKGSSIKEAEVIEGSEVEVLLEGVKFPIDLQTPTLQKAVEITMGEGTSTRVDLEEEAHRETGLISKGEIILSSLVDVTIVTK